MAVSKYKMPKVQQLLAKKQMYEKKKEPVWEYLEREMRDNADKKPYNETVGEWLKFLKDFRLYKHLEEKRAHRIMKKEIGPPWYCELSNSQREVLTELKANIHQDLIEDLPVRTRKSLSDLGITMKISKNVLLQAMKDSVEDPGVFLWHLYSAIYKKPPSELRPEYDMNAMIMMSALVFIDLDECISHLDELTKSDEVQPIPKKKPKKKYEQPTGRNSEYLQKMHVPPFESNKKLEAPKPKPITYKFKLRSEGSAEKLCQDQGFLEKRAERNKKEQQTERKCKYKFWEPPVTLRNTDPKQAAYVEKMKMFTKKARPMFKAPLNNIQHTIAGVAFAGGKPHYILQTVSILPTGYIPINGGIVRVNDEIVATLSLGHWEYPREDREKCDKTCDCLTKWEAAVMDYIKESSCKCGHLYDFYNEGELTEKYFHQPTKHGSYWIDYAKIYQMDPTEDFILDTIAAAVNSGEPSPEPSVPALNASALPEKELLGVFLADLAHSPLLIPHLPKANDLNNLQEWVRKRVHGKVSTKKKKEHSLYSNRRWLQLKKMSFRARAFRIPFSLKQLHNMTWEHREMTQELYEILQSDFVSRNRLAQLEQTRLLWATMKYDTYPGKAFLDTYFTYMPGRMKDTYIINPYSSELTPKRGGKTCPLK